MAASALRPGAPQALPPAFDELLQSGRLRAPVARLRALEPYPPVELAPDLTIEQLLGREDRR